MVKRCLTENLVNDVANLIIRIMINIQAKILNVMEENIINIIKQYYIIQPKYKNEYDLIGFIDYQKYFCNLHETSRGYDSLTFIPKISKTMKYQLNIKVSHYYNQSNFDRLRSRIDENIKYTPYQLVKCRRFKWCIELK